jgi:hypothetical protein
LKRKKRRHQPFHRGLQCAGHSERHKKKERKTKGINFFYCGLHTILKDEIGRKKLIKKNLNQLG